jgi:multidrug efflux pump subunit AcrB
MQRPVRRQAKDALRLSATLGQAAINAASGQLPKDMFTQPTYHETNPADARILVLGLTADTLPITAVDDYAESILAPKVSQVPGVGSRQLRPAREAVLQHDAGIDLLIAEFTRALERA